VLAGPLLRFVGEDTERSFEAVNAALKARAESLAGPDTGASDPRSLTSV
jgi:hypothetical protein